MQVIVYNQPMTISEIYKHFGIPPNLQEHMLRVAAVVSLIQKHWTGDSMDWETTKKLALLHDLGNVVKMDNKNHPEFLGDEQFNVDYWNQRQKEMIAKYGSDDDEATRKMLLEIGIDQKTADIIFNKRFVNSVHTKNSNNWPLIIMYYADLRVLPFGIGSLEERLSDIKKRYLNMVARPDFKDLLSACRDIEKIVQENLDISVNEINNNSIDKEITKNKDYFNNLKK